MPATPDVDLFGGWVELTASERASVHDVYVSGRTVTDSAARRGMRATDVARSLQTAHRRIAAALLDDGTGQPPVDGDRSRSRVGVTAAGSPPTPR